MLDERMDLNDYMIDQGELDWSNLLSEWTWLLPSTFTPWIVNRLGDIIIANEDDTISFFDVGCGRFQRVADSREHLIRLIDEGENANNWLAIPLVNRLVENGVLLKPKTVYGFKVPPLLGGKYDLENFEVTDISVHYGFLGDLYGQMKDVPDGSKVRVKIVNRPGSPN